VPIPWPPECNRDALKWSVETYFIQSEQSGRGMQSHSTVSQQLFRI